MRSASSAERTSAASSRVLSRSEQLLEQRQVSSVLGELRTLVEDVDERLATSEQVEQVAAEVRALGWTEDPAPVVSGVQSEKCAPVVRGKKGDEGCE